MTNPSQPEVKRDAIRNTALAISTWTNGEDFASCVEARIRDCVQQAVAAETEKLRKVLEPFATVGSWMSDKDNPEAALYWSHRHEAGIQLKHVLAATAALSAHPATQDKK